MIQVTPMHIAGQDERGFTCTWDNPDRLGQYILGYRKAGSSSGRHYHKGISPAKNPEVLILVLGKARINYRPAGTSDPLQTVEADAPARIEIPAMVWHELVAVSDVAFLEMNSLDDGKHDTFTD